MISPQYFVESLKALQIDFFTGVPDSLLKNVCAYIGDNICSTPVSYTHLRAHET